MEFHQLIWRQSICIHQRARPDDDDRQRSALRKSRSQANPQVSESVYEQRGRIIILLLGWPANGGAQLSSAQLNFNSDSDFHFDADSSLI